MKPTRKELLDQIPGEKGLPFVGMLFEFIKDPIGLIHRMENKYGQVYKSSNLGMHNVTILGKDAQKFLLLDQKDNVNSKEAWAFNLGKLFPNGLMLMDGEKHKFHRSIIRTAFLKKPMEGYLELMIPTVERELEEWSKKGKIIAFDEVKELTLQVAGKVFFGINFRENVGKVNQAIMDIVKASLSIQINLPFTTFGKGIRARKYLVNYFKDMIADKRANPGKDLFSILCHAENEEGDQLNDQQVIDHLIFILMAAHDTTASATTSWLYEMGKNPKWQEKVRAEVKNMDINQLSDAKYIRNFPHLNNTIKEALRMYPPLITVPRMSKCPIHFNNKTIPEDTLISVVMHHSHHLEEVWTNPEQFDPNRFSKERGEHQKCPHAYAPFGVGQHHCIGYAFAEMEMRLMMSLILKQFNWSFDKDYKCEFARVPLTMPKDGLPLSLNLN